MVPDTVISAKRPPAWRLGLPGTKRGPLLTLYHCTDDQCNTDAAMGRLGEGPDGPAGGRLRWAGWVKAPMGRLSGKALYRDIYDWLPAAKKL